MSLTKAIDGMSYEVAGKKEVSDATSVARKIYAKSVYKHSSAYTLWLLACKHKIGLLTLGNVVLVLNWALPEWPSMLRSIF